MNHVSAFTAQLRSEFPEQTSIQKTRALARGQALGLSNRTLAGLVGVRESTIRNLLGLLVLPADDQAAIEAGAPYSPYLKKISRIKADLRKADTARIVAAHERAANRGLQVIRRMFREAGFMPVYAEQVLGEVQARIRGGEREGILKPSELTWVDHVEAILAATKPAHFDEIEGIDRITGMVHWMCNALVRIMPNADVRERAFRLAFAQPNRLAG